MFQSLFPTCHVRVFRFYASWPSLLLLLLLVLPAGPEQQPLDQSDPQLQALDRSVPRQTRTIKVIPAGPHLQALRS